MAGIEGRVVAELPAAADEAVGLPWHDEQTERTLVDPQPEAAVTGVRAGREAEYVDAKPVPGGRVGCLDDHVTE
jgi:hypothetical protein